MSTIEYIVMFVLSGIFTILWWLLRNKDSTQQDQIKTLFTKHDEDAKELQDLRLQIASNHYQKNELDSKFDRLESTFRDGFSSLGTKFDKLSDTLLQHMQESK